MLQNLDSIVFIEMNAERFKAEVLPTRDKLIRTARRMLEDEADAEDAVQEVFLKLWQMRESLDQYDNLEAFATTMTKNRCIDSIRKRGREGPIEDELYRQAGPDDPYLSLERKSNDELIRMIIDRLPPLQQAVLKMKDIEEYELEEIAQITGTTNEAVRVNLSRARKKVREEFIRLTGPRK
jgi:RNA polymerase sigma-70 factor, ECF subfamily